MPRRFHRGGLVLFVFLLPTFFLVIFYQTSSPPSFVVDHIYFQYDLDALDPRGNAEQLCVLPRIHPFHPSIWGFLLPPKKIVCVGRRAELTIVDARGWLGFNESQVKASSYQVGKSLNCYWSKVERGGGTGNVDDTVSYSKELPLPKEGVHLPSDVEILRVVCRNFVNFAIYDRLHARIRDVEATKMPNGSAPVNVVIFGIDSLSRLSFIRNLPLTYKYLTEDLEMTVFRGMNKVGDNTFPNLVALLTGKAAYGGGLPDPKPTFDDWPLIWKNFSSAGFATLWAEDFPEFGLFNYLAGGFDSPPTLHYLRPYWLALKESPLLKVSSHMCYGSAPRYVAQMEYLRQFISTYGNKEIPFFGFSFLAELSHEYMSRVASADEHFRDFFQWFANSGHLENTLLVVMSDHGHRFDRIRTSLVGHIEERTPFFGLRVPTTAVAANQQDVLKNLRVNSGRLVSPYDIHASLADILAFAVSERTLGISPSPLGTLGRSLFGPIPSDRTCKDASIPGHYCVCESETSIGMSDKRVELAASVVIGYINRLLKDVSDKCSLLTLKGIKGARMVKTMDSANATDSEQKVRVVVETTPGEAIFEATVTLNEEDGQVWGDVSRINPYAGQSDCLPHVILRKYCFCAAEEDYKL